MSDSKKISSFRGEYAFLSNFYPCMVEFEGVSFPSAEHAFQAAKVLDTNQRINIAVCPTPADAKYFGRRLQLREDWNQIKVSVMKAIVKDKFTRNRAYRTDIQKLLLDTGDAYLEEGNSHGDQFWGTVKGEGQNWLGKILMEVRDEIRKELQDGGALRDESEDETRYRIVAAGQVANAAYCAGDVAYYMNDLYELNDIAMYGKIKRSKKWSINPDTKDKSYFVSLTRNLLGPAKENSRRWTYGVILDGNKLPSRYRISPYSESEERIWVDSGSEYIDVTGCIKGIIVPKDKDFGSSDDTMIKNMRNALGKATESFDIVCY